MNKHIQLYHSFILQKLQTTCSTEAQLPTCKYGYGNIYTAERKGTQSVMALQSHISFLLAQFNLLHFPGCTLFRQSYPHEIIPFLAAFQT